MKKPFNLFNIHQVWTIMRAQESQLSGSHEFSPHELLMLSDIYGLWLMVSRASDFEDIDSEPFTEKVRALKRSMNRYWMWQRNQ